MSRSSSEGRNANTSVGHEQIREALAGLLALTEKMFGLLQQSANRGDARMQPEGVKFDDLKYVKRARAALSSANAEPHSGTPEATRDLSARHGRENV